MSSFAKALKNDFAAAKKKENAEGSNSRLIGGLAGQFPEGQNHDEVTATIIRGILCEEIEPGGKGISKATDRIMDLLERRGYRADIKCCNVLADGSAC